MAFVFDKWSPDFTMSMPQFDELTPITVFTASATFIYVLPDDPDPQTNIPPVITSAITSDAGITVTHDSSSFTLTGQFNEVFSRTIDYIDSNNAHQTTTTFESLPPTFNAVYKYIAPTDATKSQVINVNFSNNTSQQYVVSVRNNWQVANAKLAENVNKGAF